jgi:ABC-type cobalamin/Fe3+-siderophores transport system ATPase subunit
MIVVLDGSSLAAQSHFPLNKHLDPLVSFGVEEPRLRFVGRKKELDELTAALQCDTERLWVVAGPGGMGKSQLMKQFLNNIKHKHNCVWLLGESVQTLSSSVNFLFKKLQIIDHGREGQSFPEPIQGTVEYIRNCSNKRTWIFVIDNVDENHSAAKRVVFALVKLSNVKIFITSRLRHIVGGSGKIVEVKPLSDEDAQSFVNNSLSPNQRPELVSNLCMTLQNHPLALSQAVDYIRSEQSASVKEHYSIEDYLNTFRSQSSKLLKHEVEDEHTTVFHTCSISIQVIEKKHGRAGKAAKSLLRYLAYFDPDGVSSWVFRSILSETTFKTQSLFEVGLGLLKSFSLIWIEGEIISVHRLVQNVTKLEIQNLWRPNRYTNQLLQASKLVLLDPINYNEEKLHQIHFIFKQIYAKEHKSNKCYLDWMDWRWDNYSFLEQVTFLLQENKVETVKSWVQERIIHIGKFKTTKNWLIRCEVTHLEKVLRQLEMLEGDACEAEKCAMKLSKDFASVKWNYLLLVAEFIEYKRINQSRLWEWLFG